MLLQNNLEYVKKNAEIELEYEIKTDSYITSQYLDFNQMIGENPDPKKYDIVIGNPPYMKNIFAIYKKWLLNRYSDDAMEILDLVTMITPENIHLNLFMFEPILDMSLKQLYRLYQSVKALSV